MTKAMEPEPLDQIPIGVIRNAVPHGDDTRLNRSRTEIVFHDHVPSPGFFPSNLTLANTKSSGLLYGVSACHALSTSANAGCIGTVDFDACVLVPEPICPYVQEFLMRIEFWSYRTDFHFRASASEIFGHSTSMVMALWTFISLLSRGPH